MEQTIFGECYYLQARCECLFTDILKQIPVSKRLYIHRFLVVSVIACKRGVSACPLTLLSNFLCRSVCMCHRFLMVSVIACKRGMSACSLTFFSKFLCRSVCTCHHFLGLSTAAFAAQARSVHWYFCSSGRCMLHSVRSSGGLPPGSTPWWLPPKSTTGWWLVRSSSPLVLRLAIACSSV